MQSKATEYFIDRDFEWFYEPVTVQLGNHILLIVESLISVSYAKDDSAIEDLFDPFDGSAIDDQLDLFDDDPPIEDPLDTLDDRTTDIFEDLTIDEQLDLFNDPTIDVEDGQ
jgi:hypothetical protein